MMACHLPNLMNDSSILYICKGAWWNKMLKQLTFDRLSRVCELAPYDAHPSESRRKVDVNLYTIVDRFFHIAIPTHN
jgi:hypothetical protein